MIIWIYSSRLYEFNAVHIWIHTYGFILNMTVNSYATVWIYEYMKVHPACCVCTARCHSAWAWVHSAVQRNTLWVLLRRWRAHRMRSLECPSSFGVDLFTHLFTSLSLMSLRRIWKVWIYCRSAKESRSNEVKLSGKDWHLVQLFSDVISCISLRKLTKCINEMHLKFVLSCTTIALHIMLSPYGAPNYAQSCISRPVWERMCQAAVSQQVQSLCLSASSVSQPEDSTKSVC